MRYPLGMVRPFSEREAWAQERADIPEQIAAVQRELDATPAEHTPRRERRTWTIRRAEHRRAELDAWLGRHKP